MNIFLNSIKVKSIDLLNWKCVNLIQSIPIEWIKPIVHQILIYELNRLKWIQIKKKIFKFNFDLLIKLNQMDWLHWNIYN